MERRQFRRRKPPSYFPEIFRWDRVTRDIWTATLLAGLLGLIVSVGYNIGGLATEVTSFASLFALVKLRLAIVAVALVLAHALARTIVFRFRDEKGSNNNHAGDFKSALKTAFLETVRHSSLNPETESGKDHGAV